MNFILNLNWSLYFLLFDKILLNILLKWRLLLKCRLIPLLFLLQISKISIDVQWLQFNPLFLQIFCIISTIVTIIMSTKPAKVEVKCKNDFRWAKTAPYCFLRCKQASVLVFINPKHNMTLPAFDFILSYCFMIFRLQVEEVGLVDVLLRHWSLDGRR